MRERMSETVLRWDEELRVVGRTMFVYGQNAQVGGGGASRGKTRQKGLFCIKARTCKRHITKRKHNRNIKNSKIHTHPPKTTYILLCIFLTKSQLENSFWLCYKVETSIQKQLLTKYPKSFERVYSTDNILKTTRISERKELLPVSAKV